MYGSCSCKTRPPRNNTGTNSDSKINILCKPINLSILAHYWHAHACIKLISIIQITCTSAEINNVHLVNTVEETWQVAMMQ
jgi:hypothetical protein